MGVTRWTIARVTTLVVALSVVANAFSAPATGAGAGACSEPKSAPADVGVQDNVIAGLAHLSTCNVWTVGYWSDGAGPNNDQQSVAHGLVEHWNGQTWRRFDMPVVGAAYDNILLFDVNGVAPYDLWTVGWRGDNVAMYTLAFHWNGHTWSHVPTPRPGSDSELLDVAAHTHSDAWAVGSYTGNQGQRGLIEHWDGHRWTVQSTYAGAELFGVTVTRTGKAWAVGDVSRNGKRYGLILHWTGSRWTRQAASVLPSGSSLLALAARGGNNVWAVGHQAGDTRNLVVHYTGGRWQRVATPNVHADTNSTVAVAPAADGDVWAVSMYEINGVARSQVLVRRNGSWRSVGCAPSAPNQLRSIAAAQQGEALAAGFTTGGANSHLFAAVCAQAGA